MPKKQRLYAVVDIETTGGMAKRDRITEIAIVLYDGTSVIDQFDSLVNPERSIPFEITRITGITDDMVAGSPKFYELGKKIVEMTEGAIFVAHNVRFDYSFIQEEFARLGYTYTRKQLCTVRMARKAFPGLPSYSLGNLIRHFNIPVAARHRALEDTLATVNLFDLMLHQSTERDNVHGMINQQIREQKLPEALSLQQLDDLPEKAGVYYFHNISGQVVYVGKSINIKNRVKQHFSKITAKSMALVRQVTNITFDLTGTELIALLHESEEIKNLNPAINKAQRAKDYPYFSYKYFDQDGYLCFGIEKVSKKNFDEGSILSHYTSLSAAKGQWSSIRSAFQLCETKMSIRGKKRDRCIYYAMEECLGSCVELENAEAYNERASEAMDHIQRVFDEDFLLILDGRTPDEKGLVLVQSGLYRGFGFIPLEDLDLGVEEWLEAIDAKRSNVECNAIVAHYMQTSDDFEIINL